MHASSTFQKSFSQRLPSRAPAHVYGYGVMQGYVGLCMAM